MIKVLDVLKIYAKCLGQVINIDKSAVYFSKNTLEAEKENIFSILGQRQENQIDLIGRSTKNMLDFIKERVRAKIKGWKGLFLSLAGKEGGVNCCTHVCLILFPTSRKIM